MKKIITAILALAMIIGCVAVFASCGGPKPKLDLDKAEANLKAAKYSVSHNDDADRLPADRKETLYAKDDNDNYINIYVFNDRKSANLYYKSLESELEFSIDSTKLEIKYVKNMIKKYSADLDSATLKSYENKLKQLEEELEELEDIVIGKSGKTVWSGTKEAIKATKG